MERGGYVSIDGWWADDVQDDKLHVYCVPIENNDSDRFTASLSAVLLQVIYNMSDAML